MSGSDARRIWSTTSPMFPSVVFTVAAPAVTLTASVIAPTSRTMDRSRVSLIWTCTSFWMTFLKPASSTVTV